MIKEKAKKLLKKIQSYFPSALPQTDSAFNAWADEVLDLAKLPNNDSFVQALGTNVLHLGPTTAYKSKHYFVLGLRAAVSKQSAFNAVDAIRQKERSAREAQSIKATETVVQQT